LARHVLIQRGLAKHRGLVRLEAGLNLPVVGLGASAATYYPAAGERLSCQMELPRHAGVANAIGAVVGRVTIRRSGEVSAPAEGRYRVHLASGLQDFADVDEALVQLEQHLSETAQKEAQEAGAEGIRVTVTRDIRKAEAEGREIFLQGVLTVEASGRPRIAAE